MRDPAIGIRLVRLVSKQPERLFGQVEIAGPHERLQGIRLGPEPPRRLSRVLGLGRPLRHPVAP